MDSVNRLFRDQRARRHVHSYVSVRLSRVKNQAYVFYCLKFRCFVRLFTLEGSCLVVHLSWRTATYLPVAQSLSAVHFLLLGGRHSRRQQPRPTVGDHFLPAASHPSRSISKNIILVNKSSKIRIFPHHESESDPIHRLVEVLQLRVFLTATRLESSLACPNPALPSLKLASRQDERPRSVSDELDVFRCRLVLLKAFEC